MVLTLELGSSLCTNMGCVNFVIAVQLRISNNANIIILLCNYHIKNGLYTMYIIHAHIDIYLVFTLKRILNLIYI